MITSTTPAGGAAAWTAAHIDNGTNYECYHYGGSGPSCQPALGAVSCASQTSCVTVDDAGNVLSSTLPTGGPASWSASGYTSVPASESLAFLSCPAISLCVAGKEYASQIFTGGQSGPAAISNVTLGSSDSSLTGVWCAAVSLCFADVSTYGPGLFATGSLYVATEPSGDASAWRRTYTARGGTHGNLIAAVACTSLELCFAADGLGHLAVGRRVPPAAQIRRTLGRELVPRGRGARIAIFRKRHYYRFIALAPTAGRLVANWYVELPSDGRNHRRQAQKLIASGATTFAKAGRKMLSIGLNRSGRRLLVNQDRVRLTVRSSFKPTGEAPVIVHRTVTLH